MGKSNKRTIRHPKREPEVSHFQAGDHKAHLNRREKRQSKHKAEKT